MFLLMFAALGGGLATLSVMAPFGAGVAAVCAPLGGSLCAVLAAAYVTRHGGEAGGRVDLDAQADLEAQADAMVAGLRQLAARGAKAETAPTEEDTGRVRVG